MTTKDLELVVQSFYDEGDLDCEEVTSKLREHVEEQLPLGTSIESLGVRINDDDPSQLDVDILLSGANRFEDITVDVCLHKDKVAIWGTKKGSIKI